MPEDFYDNFIEFDLPALSAESIPLACLHLRYD
jgi:hypothetical protein